MRIEDCIYKNISFKFDADISQIDLTNKENVLQFLMSQFNKQLKEKEVALKNEYFYLRFAQKSILKAINSGWINQVDNLQQLKGSVNNRQSGQRNAIFEYHKSALDSFESMNYKIKGNIIRNLCQSMITYDEDDDLVIYFP